jgi:hypothetical protein
MFITRAVKRGVDVKVIAGWQGDKDGGKLILDTLQARQLDPRHSNGAVARRLLMKLPINSQNAGARSATVGG